MRQRSRVTFVIMAGGKGERLWPLARRAIPKVCLSPDGKRSLLVATINRLRPVWPGASWRVVTTQEQARAVRRALPRGFGRAVLVEPEGKGTAACITLAALATRDPHTVLVVVPADHWVSKPRKFQQALACAIRAAVTFETIATIGVAPTHAHPGLGYLRVGAMLGRLRGGRVFKLKQFLEKPSRARAGVFVRSGCVLWNTGIFVATNEQFLEQLRQWLPVHVRRLARLGLGGSPRQLRDRARRVYPKIRTISFDHGVMERMRTGVVVEGRFGWADLGSWDAWARVSPDAKWVGVDSRNVRVISKTPHVVATIGVRDLLVVHTPAATLICSRERTQGVREVVRKLAEDPTLAPFA